MLFYFMQKKECLNFGKLTKMMNNFISLELFVITYQVCPLKRIKFSQDLFRKTIIVLNFGGEIEGSGVPVRDKYCLCNNLRTFALHAQ